VSTSPQHPHPAHPHARNPQQPSRMPIHRCAPFPPSDLPDRTWPPKVTTVAPRWCAVDRAAAYVECAVGDRILWGVGIDPNVVTASLRAVVSAVNRAQR
jgi:hypothetical protein